MKSREITGERLVTEILNENTIEHLHRYAIIKDYVQGKIVLDIACGEGYGSNIISSYATHTIGVDIDSESILDAKKKYVKENLEFKIGRADDIPIQNNSVDVVVSFETLEHHDKHHEMLKEIKRVLKHDGCLIMSSPDKKNFSDENSYKNPFHIKELYIEEFKELINKYFKHTSYYNQRFFSGSFILAEQVFEKLRIYGGDYNTIKDIGDFKPMYNIVIASDSDLKTLQSSIFISDAVMESIRNETAQLYTQAFTWRVGKLLLTPIQVFKKLLGKVNR